MKPTRYLVASLLGMVICAGTASAQEPDPRMVKRILESAKSIQKDVEKLRGLKFRTDVTKGVQSREVMKKDVIGKMRKEFGSQKMRDGVLVLRTFGFVPKDFDFGEGLAQFYGSQIGGYYDPEAKRLFLIAGKGGGQAQEMNDQFVMAHELGHALQDQHFDLMRYNRLFDGHDDKTMAFKALVEGEATLIGFRWLGNKQPMLRNFSVKRFFEMNRRMAQQMPNADPNQKKLAKLPEFLTENAMFPYEMGGNFVEIFVNKKGFKAITELFYNPPLSTEQILHPEKYMGPNKDYPWTVHMAKLNENLGAKEYRHVFRDTVGEWQTVLLLKALGVSQNKAYAAAAGWGGDRYQCFVHKKSKRPILTWLTVWDSKAEAKEFETTYRAALEKRYGKNHPWTLERRKSRVLLIDGANAEESKKIARMSWESYISRDSFKPFPELKKAPPLSDFGVKAKKFDGKKPKLYNTKPVAKGKGKTITEPSTRTRFTLPNNKWKEIDEDVDVLRQFSRGRYADKKAKQELRFLELPLEYNEKTMARRLEGLLSQGARGVKRHGKKKMKIQGRSALKIDLEGTVPGERDRSRLTILAVDYSESTLLFLFKAPPANWKTASANLDGIIGSLKLGRVLMADALKKGRRIECKGTVFSMIQPKGWKRLEGPNKYVVLKLQKAKGTTIYGTHFEAPQKNISVARLGRSIEATLKMGAPNYKKIGSEIRDFSGQKAYVLDYTAQQRGEGLSRVRHIAFLLNGTAELRISIKMPADKFDEQLVDGIVDTIEILNPEAEAPKVRIKNRNLDVKKAPRKKKKARLY